MADIATAMRTHLLAQSSITTLIGQRLHPGLLPPRATLPAVTYLLVGHEHEAHLTGQSGVAHAVIRYDAYNFDPLDSRRDNGIVEKMRLVLLDPSYWHTTVQGVWIEHTKLLTGPIELPSPPQDASAVYRFRTMCDYRVSYAEAKPT